MVAGLPLPPPGEGLGRDSICATWHSRDGGESWTRHEHPIPGCADPWTAITPEGVALFAGLSEDGAVVFRSSDGGSSWHGEPFNFGRGHDHPSLAVDTTDGSFAGDIYLASGAWVLNRERQDRAAVHVARSNDGGATFPYSSRVIASNLSYEALVPAILSDGTPFADHHTLDGRRIPIGARRSWVLRSGDGGRTFTAPLYITGECDGRGGWPSLVSGPEDVLWFTCIAPDFRGVLVFRSQDRGESWSGPVRPDLSEADGYTRTPAIAVSSSGVIGVAWYDRRDDPERNCQHIYFAASFDGGVSFLPELRVSSEPSCPETEANGWTASRFPAGGDYSGLVATGPSSFRLLWSDARDGLYRLRSARVTVHSDSEGTASGGHQADL